MWAVPGDIAHGSDGIETAQQTGINDGHHFIGRWSFSEGDKGSDETSIEIIEKRLPNGDRVLAGSVAFVDTMFGGDYTGPECVGTPTYSSGLRTLVLSKPEAPEIPSTSQQPGPPQTEQRPGALNAKPTAMKRSKACITLRIYKGKCFMNDMPVACP